MNGRVVGAPPQGVVVSDGRSVVRTSPDGSFELEPAGPFVFICVPTGHATDRWYVPSDGDLTFELRTVAQPVPFSFAQIADLHLSVAGWVFGADVVTTPASVVELLDEVAARCPDAAFVVSTGDQTNNGTDDEYAAYLDAVSSSSVRVIAIPGNHDHNSATCRRLSRTAARSGPGVAYTPYDRFMGPRWFSFDHGGVHFVAIDWTTHHLGWKWTSRRRGCAPTSPQVDDGTPVIFLTHDLMSSDFFERVGASAGRVVLRALAHEPRRRSERRAAREHRARDVRRARLPPAHWRIVTWDGERVRVETVRRGRRGARSDRRRAGRSAAPAAANRAGPVVADGSR